ncbi:MAG: DUF6116 family protein [Thermoanaerobaculia bacterium]
MSSNDRALVGRIKDFVAGFNSWYLVTFMAALFLVDLFVFDPLPFLDEIVLFVVTLLLARWKGAQWEQDRAPKPPPKDVTPPASE